MEKCLFVLQAKRVEAFLLKIKKSDFSSSIFSNNVFVCVCGGEVAGWAKAFSKVGC